VLQLHSMQAMTKQILIYTWRQKLGLAPLLSSTSGKYHIPPRKPKAVFFP
jgi:hypothetical protein